VIDVTGLAVAPGFINMLSWAAIPLMHDGRSLGNIHQGVTLEVFGEGTSEGPISQDMVEMAVARQGDIKFEINWSTLGEFLDHLARKGVSANIASFVGATTVRIHELGFEDRSPNQTELANMQRLVREAMRDGAMGVGSSLIYAPGFYATIEELIALQQAAAEFGGMYISHMRSEGRRILPAIDELIRIAEETNSPAEIYHLKVAGKENWSKFPQVIKRIEMARARGLAISANMYTYTAGSTGLDAAMPPWAQEGGVDAWIARLRDPRSRADIANEMLIASDNWENLMRAAGPDNTLLVGFRNPTLRHLTGKTLAEVARERNQPPHETAIDLVIEDGSKVQVIYFLMHASHVSQIAALPWVSFGSDAGSLAPEGIFLNTNTHPRAYGNFARLLGKYVRDENSLSLPLAIHKLTGLPATNLKLRQRGELREGYFADVVVFDPLTIRDNATYDAPHQLASGMKHVIVNGIPVLLDSEHTGALPGRVVRGPGWRGHP
jgi:N-acyl-D-amino-acid deacylase